MMMEWVKIVHVTCAVLTISGFMLRSVWMMTESALLQHPLSKRLPHVNDSVLLIAAIILVYDDGLNPFEHAWLLAKILVLLLYIGFGLLAVLCFVYIVQTVITKNLWVS